MSEEKKPSTRVFRPDQDLLDLKEAVAVAGDESPPTNPTKPKPPRFTSAGLDDVPGYEGVRFRRWEPYQIVAIKGSLTKRNIDCTDKIDASDPDHLFMCSTQLVTGLVGPEKKGTQTLHRPGKSGIKKVRKDLTPEKLVETFRAQLLFSGVLK